MDAPFSPSTGPAFPRVRTAPTLRAVNRKLSGVAVAFLVATGGLTGILAGTVVLDYLRPGHPWVEVIRASLRSLLGM